MIWLNAATVATLAVTTVFTYMHASYGTAAIAAGCTGLAAGINLTRWVIRKVS